MAAKRGSRVGAAAFVLGLSLVGHQAGVAAADNPDTGSPSADSGSAGPAKQTGPARASRAGAAEKGANSNRGRTAGPARGAEPAGAGTGGDDVLDSALPAAASRAGLPATPILPPAAKGSSGGSPVPAGAGGPQPLPSPALAPAVAPTAGSAGLADPPPHQPSRRAKATTTATTTGTATATATATVAPAAAAVAGSRAAAAASAVAGGSGCSACWGSAAPTIGQAINTVINHLFNSTFEVLSTLPGNPISNLLEGALVLVRRSLFWSPLGVTASQVGNELTVSVNTGSVAYFRQDGTTLEVSGVPTFGAAQKFDAATVAKVAVANSTGNAGCAGLVVDSGTITAALQTSQIDAIRFDSGAAFTGTVASTVTGGPLTLRDAVRGLGGVTLNAAVILGNDVQVDAGSGDVTFTGAVDAAKAGKQSLTVTALGTTSFEAAVGGQAALASLLTRGIAPVDIRQSPGVSTTIPLYYMPVFYTPGSGGNGQVQVKYGIDVAIGDNAPRTFVFDTGGNAFWAGYNPTYWQGVTLGTDPVNITYTSGNYYNAVVTDAPVTIGPAGGPTVSTGQPVEIGAILSAGNGSQSFAFTNPYAPPVDGRFSGDFGAAFGLQPSVSGDTNLTSVLFQLPGNLSSGFLVQLGPIGSEQKLTVGITDALREQFPYAVPVSPLSGAGTYPVSGYQVLQQFGFAAQYSVKESETSPPITLGNESFPQCAQQCLPSLIDSGAPSTSVRLPGAPQPYPLSIEKNQVLKPGSIFVATLPTTQGRPPLTWTFVAGDNGSVNAVSYASASGAATTTQNVNTGLNLYNGYDAMFDLQKQVIWLRPNGGQSDVGLQSVTTTGDQTYQQNAQLGGTYTATNGDFAVAGVTALTADTSVVVGGDVTFSGTVDGPHSLEVSSPGASAFVRGVGQLTPLTKLTTDVGGSTATAGVTTAGDQSYGDNVSLSGLYSAAGGDFTVAGSAELATPVEVQTAGGGIAFDGTIDSGQTEVGFALRLSTEGGRTALNGAVGATNPLGGLGLVNSGTTAATVSAGSTIAMNGALGNANPTGMFIGDNVTVSMTEGGTIENFTASGVVFNGRSTGSTISNFVIASNVYDGIQLAAGGNSGPYDYTGTQIAANEIYGNGAFGIETMAPVSGLQITGNLIGKPGTANPWDYVTDGPNVHGIALAPGNYSGVSISGNTITDNVRSGIFAPGGVQNLTINANQLMDNGSHGVEFVTGDFAGTVISNNVISDNNSDGIALGAGIGQGIDTGGNPLAGYNDSAGFTDAHYVLSYQNNPDFYNKAPDYQPPDPLIAMTVGTKNLNVPLDTGSRGLYFDQFQLDPDVLTANPVLGPGHIYLNSSNRLYFGQWVQVPITFTGSYYEDANGQQDPSRRASATVPLLVVQAVGASTTPKPGQMSNVTTFGTTIADGTITITDGTQTMQAVIVPNALGGGSTGTVTIPGGFWAVYADNTYVDGQGQTKPKLSSVSNFGVGFDRTGQGTAPTTDGTNQNYNAFLNLTEMQAGTMRAGYVMGATGVKLGLDSTVKDFAYTTLSPTGLIAGDQSPPDWQPGTGTLAINNGQPYGSGQVVLDMGYDGGILTVPNLTGGFPANGTLTVNLLNSPTAEVSYRVTPSTGRENLLNPSGISLFNPLGGGYSENAPPLSQQFFNTGRNAFAGLDYLYDAASGHLGLAIGSTQQAKDAFAGADGKLTPAYYANPNAPTGVTNVTIVDNTITNNGGAGVLVNASASKGNAILGNTIYANTDDGIVLSRGANAGQAAPQGVTATRVNNTIAVDGSVTAVPGYSGAFTVQAFASPAAQSGGTGGRYYLGEFTVPSAGTFLQEIPAGSAAPGDVITLTATPTTNNTSQFSTPAVIQ